MKKILLILILLLLTGCQAKTDIVSSVEEDIILGAGSEVIDSYSESNYGIIGELYNGGTTFGGQSFTATDRFIISSKFYLSKTGSPTGNIVSKIYNCSGTYGTNNIPTGDPLATSSSYDVSSLTTAMQLIEFTFSDSNRIKLISGNKYCIGVSYSGGNSSNKVFYGADNTSPSHSGNFFFYNSSSVWSSLNSADVVFYVYGDEAIYSTAGDGHVSYENLDWATLRGAATGDSNNYTYAYLYTRSVLSFFGDNPMVIDRSFLPFDTSAIPDDAIITSAILYVYMDATPVCTEFTPSYFLGVVQTSQASSTILTNADYDAVGSVAAATTTFAYAEAVYASSTYMEFPLNATGLSWIKKSGETSNCGTKTGVTCLGLREGHDLENISIVDQACVQRIVTSEGDADKKPYLVVNYTFQTLQEQVIIFE
jgi:hypothetical protein